ncbi:outer membrane transport energization protein TonB [Nitrobacter hamburgensis X14]|uniref:Outer membrane transport energization protein TonB n=1 Tax=Nitrobacter hamburgensis (strain DSM 10229 / NCIMB 13809 / X14) TaxID=323097 RepID=Q1QQ65_NITHX|nr:energy transducer TonB [Nitrobacter hamburgensis]ABE61632.1 outer membrane transport energization protein TonB [Nitrobacter hamburgensis X14]
MRIDWRDPDGRIGGTVRATSALRWTAAGLAVVALHAGGIWLALNWPAAAEAPGDPPAAIMMELAPLAVAPEVPQQDIAPGPQMVEAEEQPEPEKPVEEKVEPQPELKTPVETEIKPPELPKMEKAEVVLPPKAERPKPKPKPKKKKQKKAPRTTAPPTSQAQRADRAVAPAEGLSSSMSRASWRGALMAHLNRYKRFPPGAVGTGVATVAFTIDRSGRVLSARLVRSAGDAALDAEAASLPRRASPVPAPPPNIGGGSITLAVPIRFSR